MYIFYVRKGKSMKHNKILGLLGIAAALTLVACGGSKSGATPAKSTAGKTSKAPTSRAPVSREPVPTATIESQLLEKRADGKVYFKVTGKVANYAAGALKWAWGLTADDTEFVYGKAAPEAADFTALTFDANNAFSTEFCITDIANIPTGVYHIYGGDTAATYAQIEIEDGTFQARDARYDYFMRSDQSSTGLAIEDLGPFAITTGDFVKNPAEGHEGIYLKLGGAQATPFTQETANGWNTMADFQRMGQYTKDTSLDKYWVVDGNNAYFYIAIGSMKAGENWMTHLTANAPAGTRDAGKALGSVDFTVTKEFTEENLKLTVISDTSKGQNDGEAAYYGAIGVKVEYVTEPETPTDGGEQA
jgi:hypothetical protein